VPTGHVKWYDVDKGFGFIATDDEGEDVFVHLSALPAGVPSLKPGTRVEFGVAEGRRGTQAMSLRLLDPLPSVTKSRRKDADDLAIIIEDLIKMLDNVGGSLRRGKYPDDRTATKLAAVLRAVAEDFDA
jgi:cold shock protein